MANTDDRLKLIFRVGAANSFRSIVNGVAAIVAGVLLLYASGVDLPLGVKGHHLGYFLCAFGVFTVVSSFRLQLRDAPTFYADRSGFRIRGGRLKKWSAYHGVRVREISGGNGRKTRFILQIKLRPEGLFAHKGIARIYDLDEAYGMADKIIGLKNRLDAVWLKEADRIDLTLPPVLRARVEADRRPAPHVPLFSHLKGFLSGSKR